MKNILMILAGSAVIFLCTACSDTFEKTEDGSGGADGPVAADMDPGGLPDGYGPLWPCEVPGQSCNAHDPCAINAICDKNKLCRPSTLQNCNDNLACTSDVCKGMGLCENSPKTGSCALSVKSSAAATDGGAEDGGAEDGGAAQTVVKCFAKGAKNPTDSCQLCDPDTSSTSWSPANGGSCDDGDQCTKDDYCQNGLCKGVDFKSQCADQYACTEDLCDGKGGCLGNKLKSTWCLINGACYMDNANHPSGTCFTCDAAASQSTWTPISNTCMIGGACYKKGDKNPGGCAECDPSTSTSAWTVKVTTHCLINGSCHAAGAKDATGCSACDPSKDSYAFSALPGLCKISGVCYAQGAKNPAGLCAECDAATSSSSWTVKGTADCLISGACVTSGTKDATGCGVCDPTQDKYSYSAVAGQCKIGNACHASGAKHTGGCAECKPSVSSTSWTLTSTTGCLISGLCYAPNQTVGCFKCDPTTSQTAWTQIAGCTSMNLDIGAYKSTYSSSNGTRGYWFTSPVAFTIIGLRVPTDVGTAPQTIEVMKFAAVPPNFSATTSSFTSLAYHKGVSGTGFISVNIAVAKGDIIGVLGARGTTSLKNSYGQTGAYTTKISNLPVTLTRLILQKNLYSQKADFLSSEPSGNLGRIEMKYKP